MSEAPPIPALTDARLSEFWRGIIHATQDRGALCELTHYAAGGLRIDITWKQGGKRYNYPATLTAKELASAGLERNEKVVLGFIAATLDAVRKMRNRNAGVEELDAPSARLQPTGVENAVAMLIGTARSRQHSPPPATAPPEEKSDDSQVPSDPQPGSAEG